MLRYLISILKRSLGAPLRMNRKLSLLLIVSFSLFFVGAAFHHHEDGASHEECAICFSVCNHSISLFDAAPQIAPSSYQLLLVGFGGDVNLSCICPSPYANRAPPASPLTA